MYEYGDFFRDASPDWESYITTGDEFGGFDSKLDFQGSRLWVTVRLAWRFGHSFKRNKFGGSVLWSSQRQDQFKASFRNLILDYWDERYPIEIRHTPTGTMRTVIPKFQLVDVPDGGGGQHMKIWVSALPAAQSSVGKRCKLHAYDADDDPSHSVLRRIHAWGIKRRGVLKTMGQAIQDLAKGGVKFARDRVDLDAQGRDQLDRFAESLHVELPIFPALEIKVKSHRLPDENPALDGQRVAAVRAYLMGKGFPAKDLVEKPGGTVSGPLLSLVRGVAAARPYVTLQYRKSITQKFIDGKYIYPIAAHEFGHMLGLPDEYHLSEKESSGQQGMHENYYHLCDKFHVPRPPRNTTSMSMMAGGNQLLRSHYVTLAQAVRQHLMRFYSQESLLNRLRVNPTNGTQMTPKQLQDTWNTMDKDKPWDDYAITIGPMLRQPTKAEMVPLQRYIPLEATPDAVTVPDAFQHPSPELGPTFRADDFDLG
ncbi:MAG TPA: hypothetical protein VHS97_11370 [Isosphaeraceae bacterium]|nr:hypothetical protein [Isosphaeraceae bacterium]